MASRLTIQSMFLLWNKYTGCCKVIQLSLNLSLFFKIWVLTPLSSFPQIIQYATSKWSPQSQRCYLPFLETSFIKHFVWTSTMLCKIRFQDKFSLTAVLAMFFLNFSKTLYHINNFLFSKEEKHSNSEQNGCLCSRWDKEEQGAPQWFFEVIFWFTVEWKCIQIPGQTLFRVSGGLIYAFPSNNVFYRLLATFLQSTKSQWFGSKYLDSRTGF